MSGSESCGEGGTPLGSVTEVIARVERLAATPRPVEGYAIEWAVEAFHLGELPPIAAVALRANP